MRALGVLVLFCLAILVAGCSGSMRAVGGTDPDYPLTLVFMDARSREPLPLPTENDGTRVWSNGVVDAPILVTHAPTANRGGVPNNEVGIRITRVGSNLAANYDFDRENHDTVWFHEDGDYKVETILGTVDSEYPVLAEGWLRIRGGRVVWTTTTPPAPEPWGWGGTEYTLAAQNQSDQVVKGLLVVRLNENHDLVLDLRTEDGRVFSVNAGHFQEMSRIYSVSLDGEDGVLFDYHDGTGEIAWDITMTPQTKLRVWVVSTP